MKNLRISTEVLDDYAKVVLDGELILMDALKLKPELASLARKHNGVEINLRNVTKIDLTGLNALLAAKVNSKVGSTGISLNVGKGHPVFELLHLTKFTDQFQFISNDQV